MEPEPLVSREEIVGLRFGVADILNEHSPLGTSWEAAMKKKMSKAEREALDARTEESIRRLRALAEKGQAELDARKAQQSQ